MSVTKHVRAPESGEILARARGLDLIGAMRGSGYRVPPALVRRSDGQTLRLTPLIYTVLEEIRDDRTAAEVAAHVTTRLNRTVSAHNVETLVRTQLRPLGLVVGADGSEPVVRRSVPLLALRWKLAVTDARSTRRIARPFAALFNPALAILTTGAFLWIAWWVLFRQGLASATYEAFNNAALLLVILAVMLLSAGFHELGHAAAARRGGATPGVMGVGLYLIWPAFYTDVTDSYRLGRLGRLRTDLGGLYFDALVTVGVFGVWLATGWDAWLLVVATQVLGMLRQLSPMVRFDGYQILCDLTGVPDLFSRIKPMLLAFLPRYRRSPEVRALKRWVRPVVAAWVLTVVPALTCALVMLVITLPRLAGTAWLRVREHSDALAASAGQGDWLDAGGRLVAVLATGLPVVAVVLLLGRVAYHASRRTWRATRGKKAQRGIAILAGLGVLAGIAYAWWPNAERYRPVQPWERGTVLDAAPASGLAHAASDLGRAQAYDLRGAQASSTTHVGYTGRADVTYPANATTPTKEHPQLALVLIPRASGSASAPQGTARSTRDAGGTATQSHSSPTPAPNSGGDGNVASGNTWVFPFDRPLEPRPGDNQALAVNTTDGSTTYDVAFAMVWVTDGGDVDQHNEAWAVASCSNCTTVAVAFQVIYVVGQSNAIIPQNISVAANYNCFSCVTAALAQQLVVTLDRMPSDETIHAIQELWNGLMTFSQTIWKQSLAEIQQTLDGFEVQVLTLLLHDGALQMPTRDPTTGPTPGPTTGPTPGPTSSTTPSTLPTPPPTASGVPTSPPTTSPTGQASGSPTEGSTPTDVPTTAPGTQSTSPATQPPTTSPPTSSGPSPSQTASDGASSTGGVGSASPSTSP